MITGVGHLISRTTWIKQACIVKQVRNPRNLTFTQNVFSTCRLNVLVPMLVNAAMMINMRARLLTPIPKQITELLC
jgi:hypothetical protein